MYYRFIVDLNVTVNNTQPLSVYTESAGMGFFCTVIWLQNTSYCCQHERTSGVIQSTRF